MGIRVGILGGGIAGMTAAHELALRGFEVHVFDKRDIPGGKARSYYRGEGIHERRGMPGEHGFRFFPGFYQHLPDTMSRIPFPGNKNGVLDNLVGATKCEIARQGHRAIITPIKVPESFSGSFSDAYDLARCLIQFLQLGIKPQEVVYYLARLIMFASSCEARRVNEFEKMSWWDFIGAKDRSINYQLYLATGMTRTLVAAQADKISARSGAQILLQLLFNIANPFRDADRVLNGPTEEVWIWPWYEELIRKGVNYYFETEVLDIECVGNRIESVTVCGKPTHDVPSRLQFDFYVASLPVEVFRKLLTPEMCAADPSLYSLHELNVANMNGVQFYLREDVPLSQGHTIYVDSKWGLTSISQQQFWRNPIAQNYGDGSAAGILSVDVSNWEGIGILYGKPLKQLHTADEVKNEVWAQLKSDLSTAGATVLEDSNLAGFNVDADIRESTNLLQLKSNERLLINTVGSLFNRPHAYTKIENLFLASD
jgi:15-cis-phytoene desaturase